MSGFIDFLRDDKGQFLLVATPSCLCSTIMVIVAFTLGGSMMDQTYMNQLVHQWNQDVIVEYNVYDADHNSGARCRHNDEEPITTWFRGQSVRSGSTRSRGSNQKDQFRQVLSPRRLAIFENEIICQKRVRNWDFYAINDWQSRQTQTSACESGVQRCGKGIYSYCPSKSLYQAAGNKCPVTGLTVSKIQNEGTDCKAVDDVRVDKGKSCIHEDRNNEAAFPIAVNRITPSKPCWDNDKVALRNAYDVDESFRHNLDHCTTTFKNEIADPHFTKTTYKIEESDILEDNGLKRPLKDNKSGYQWGKHEDIDYFLWYKDYTFWDSACNARGLGPQEVRHLVGQTNNVSFYLTFLIIMAMLTCCCGICANLMTLKAEEEQDYRGALTISKNGCLILFCIVSTIFAFSTYSAIGSVDQRMIDDAIRQHCMEGGSYLEHNFASFGKFSAGSTGKLGAIVFFAILQVLLYVLNLVLLLFGRSIFPKEQTHAVEEPLMNQE